MRARRIRIGAVVASLALVAAVSAIGPTAGASSASPSISGASLPPRPASLGGAAQPHATPGLCTGGLCEYYASMYVGSQSSTGVTAMFNQTRPKVVPGERSLAMIAIGSADGKQAILFGWMVSKTGFGDTLPHIATNAVVNDSPTCLNGCGFVPVTKKPPKVAVGRLGKYTIKLSKARWWLVYNGTTLGYYPTSLWRGNKLSRNHVAAAFGAVSSHSKTTPRSDMGNGRLGTNKRSAKFVGVALLHSVGTPQYEYVAVDAPTKYTIGFTNPSCTNACSMNYGGPGF